MDDSAISILHDYPNDPNAYYDESNTTRYYYYDTPVAGGDGASSPVLPQVVEIKDGSGDTTDQFVWGPAWVAWPRGLDGERSRTKAWPCFAGDATDDSAIAISRDHTHDPNNVLEQRLYAAHDTLYSVLELVDEDGNVVERYSYSPYGSDPTDPRKGLARITDADENGLSYEYDFENRLALLYDDVNDNHVYDPNVDTPIAEFAHDALGRRIVTVDHTANPAVTTLYYYDDRNVLAEFDGGSGNLNRYYVNGPTYVDERVLVYDVATAAEYYYLLKELYTVAGLADADGRIVELYDYDAYGTVRVHQPLAPQADGDYDDDGDVDLVDFIAFQVCFVGGGTGCDVFDFDDDQQNEDIDDYLTFALLFGGPEVGAPYATQVVSRSDLNSYFFTGRRLDQLAAGGPGMYHYRRRAYDPVHGRFLQRDPIGYVDGMNLYEYARSRALNLLDPYGRLTHDEFMALAKRVAVAIPKCRGYPYSLSPKEMKLIVAKAVRITTKSDKFRDLIQTGRDSVQFWQKFMQAFDGPWDTAEEFYDRYVELGGEPFEMGEDLKDLLEDKHRINKYLDSVELLLDGSQVAYDFLHAQDQTTPEAVQSFANILKFGKGLSGMTGAMKKLDGIGPMLTYYLRAVEALAKKMGEIEDRLAKLNVKALELCECPSYPKVAFSLEWAKKKD